MRVMFCIGFIFQIVIINAQLQYNYNNSNLNLPEWLTNPNYVAENATEESRIDVEEINLATFNDINIVELRMFESEHSSGSTSIYLGTFNKKRNIIDIAEVSNLTSSDWNWQGELSFEEIEPGIIKYYCVDLTYTVAENNEEQDATGGMVLSNSDTIITYFKISKDGSITYSNDLEELKIQKDKFVNKGIEDNKGNDNSEQDKLVENIRQVFADINKNLSSYEKKEKKSGSNIIVTYYYKNSSLRKMTENNASNGQSVDYYFDKQELVFIYAHNKTKNTESRYYFNNSEMFRWLKGKDKDEISPSSEEFKTKGKELLSRSKSLSEN
jgi:hypothetical protein